VGGTGWAVMLEAEWPAMVGDAGWAGDADKYRHPAAKKRVADVPRPASNLPPGGGPSSARHSPSISLTARFRASVTFFSFSAFPMFLGALL
jgi:hypothetical protein